MKTFPGGSTRWDARQDARQGSSVHLLSLRNDILQHRSCPQNHRIRKIRKTFKDTSLPSCSCPEHIPGLWSSNPSQESCTAMRLIIDLKPCTPLETRVFPLCMRKLRLLPTAGEHQPCSLGAKSLPSEALLPCNHVGGSSEQQLTTPWFCLQERVLRAAGEVRLPEQHRLSPELAHPARRQ